MLALSLITKLRAQLAGSTPAKSAPSSGVASIETRFHRPVDANGAMTKVVATTMPLGSLTPTVITTEFTYDVRQRMVRVKLNDGRTVDNEYMPNSPLRLWFTAPAAVPGAGAKTQQLWDPVTGNPLQDLDGSNALVTDYLMGNRIDEPLGRVAGGATHAFLGDQLMSIRGLVDSAGLQVNQYTYAAFGLGRSQVEAVANRLRFTARELDPATGLQFNRNRHYLAALGRWTQRDPIGFVDGPNLYAYVGSNPIARVDPTGLAWNAAECAKAMEDLRNLIFTCNQLPCGEDRDACLAASTGMRRRIVENCPGGPDAPRPIPLPIPVPTPVPEPPPQQHYRPIPGPPWWIIIPILIPFPGNPIYGGI